MAGDLALAQSRLKDAAEIVVSVPDPIGDIYMVGVETMILGMTGASSDRIAAAGRRGLDSAEAWGLEYLPRIRPPCGHGQSHAPGG